MVSSPNSQNRDQGSSPFRQEGSIEFPASLSFQNLAASAAGQFYKLFGGKADTQQIELIISALFMRIVEQVYSYDPMGTLRIAAFNRDQQVVLVVSHAGVRADIQDLSSQAEKMGFKISPFDSSPGETLLPPPCEGNGVKIRSIEILCP